MKTNREKCHLIVSTNELTEIQIEFQLKTQFQLDFSVKNSGSKNMLGVNNDSKLNFDCHVNQLCNKENKKLRALARVKPYMTQKKRKFS